jgi:hypothetical protein
MKEFHTVSLQSFSFPLFNCSSFNYTLPNAYWHLMLSSRAVHTDKLLNNKIVFGFKFWHFFLASFRTRINPSLAAVPRTAADASVTGFTHLSTAWVRHGSFSNSSGSPLNIAALILSSDSLLSNGVGVITVFCHCKCRIGSFRV